MEPRQSINFSITAGSVARIVGVLVLCLALFLVRDIILVVLTSVVIASSLEPAIRFLSRYRVPRTGAVLLIYSILILFGGIFVYFLVPTLITETVSFVRSLPNLFDSLNVGSFSSLETALQGVSASHTFGDYITSITSTLGTLGSGPVEVGTYLFGGVTMFTLIFILSFYLSAQKDGVGEFLRIITPLEHEPYIIGLWRRAQRNIGRWMQGQLVLGVLVGVFVFIGLHILGIRHALLLAIVSALFEIIPVFGPILGSLPGIIIGFGDGGVGLALLVAGLYVIIQQLESNVIYPLVVKKVIGVPPLVVIISLLAGFTLGGFLGVILAVPIATVCIEYLHDRERFRRGTI